MLFTTNPNFSLDVHLFKLVEKNKLSMYFWASLWIVISWLKTEFFCQFQQKCLKTTEMHSLALCGSLCEEKQFLFIFVQFYSFEQKWLFTTNPNLTLDLLLFKLVEKNKLSDYFWASFWDSFFFLKREFFSEIHRKCLKITGKHSLAVLAHFDRKNSFC